MFDTVIILSGHVEQRTLPLVLQGHRPSLTIITPENAAELAALSDDLLARARLIAFVTPEIVPKRILDALGYGAFNFHPGPPSYPGWAPSHFALYERAAEFGATLHVMVEKVDAGPIIDVERFPFPADISVLGLEGLAYAHLARLFWRWGRYLATDPAPPLTLPMQWSGKTNSKRAYRALCEISPDLPKDELDRRIRVFGGNHFGIAPTIRLHGFEFRAVPPPACGS